MKLAKISDITNNEPMKPNSRAFLEELPKNGNKILPSAIKAGYKESYARARGKTILKTALKAQAKEIIATLENKPIPSKEIKRMMSEIVGLTQEDIMKNLRFLATQEKDLSTRLKVIAPLAKEYGVHLTEDEGPKTIVPILNIGVRQTEPLIDGSTEPPIDQ